MKAKQSPLFARRIRAGTQVAGDELLSEEQWSRLFPPRRWEWTHSAGFWQCLDDSLPRVPGTRFGLRFLCQGGETQQCWFAGPEAESRGGTRAQSWASSPGGCQLKLSWLSSWSAGGIPGWPLCCILGREVPFRSQNKLNMKWQSTFKWMLKMCYPIPAGDTLRAAVAWAHPRPWLSTQTSALCFSPTTSAFDLCSGKMQGKVLSQTTSRSRLTLSVWNIYRAIECPEEGMAGIWVYHSSLNQTPPQILLRLSGKVI